MILADAVGGQVEGAGAERVREAGEWQMMMMVPMAIASEDDVWWREDGLMEGEEIESESGRMDATRAGKSEKSPEWAKQQWQQRAE